MGSFQESAPYGADVADDGVARSLFLAGLMVVSVMVGILFFDVEKEGQNLAPIIEGEIPSNILFGSIDSLSLSITDEEMGGLTVTATLDENPIQDMMDADGNLIIDISEDMYCGSLCPDMLNEYVCMLCYGIVQDPIRCKTCST